MLELIPARFRTPAVARAMASPSAIICAGAAAALPIASGLPLLLAPAAGVAGYVARVGFTALRGVPKTAAVDPFALHEPWRGFVREAIQAKARFDKTQHNAEAGPLRDRLATLGERIGLGVTTCWQIARQAELLSEALRQFDVAKIYSDLDAVKQERTRDGASDTLTQTTTAIQAQVSSYERMKRVADDAQDRLRLINAQLDEAVARAVELSVQRNDADSLNSVSTDIESLLREMENLREAVALTSSIGPDGEKGSVSSVSSSEVSGVRTTGIDPGISTADSVQSDADSEQPGWGTGAGH